MVISSRYYYSDMEQLGMLRNRDDNSEMIKTHLRDISSFYCKNVFAINSPTMHHGNISQLRFYVLQYLIRNSVPV